MQAATGVVGLHPMTLWAEFKYVFSRPTKASIGRIVEQRRILIGGHRKQSSGSTGRGVAVEARWGGTAIEMMGHRRNIVRFCWMVASNSRPRAGSCPHSVPSERRMG